MPFNTFIQGNSDSDLVKSLYDKMLMNDEEPPEELVKALDKTKLVQVQRQVQGKNGVFTRMQWVSPNDVKSTDKVVGGNVGAIDDKSKAHADEKHNSRQSMIELLKTHGRDGAMKMAESQGVTWKKNDHEGINWMRASMAIQNAMKDGKFKVDGDAQPTDDTAKNVPTDDSKSNDTGTPKAGSSESIRKVKVTELDAISDLVIEIRHDGSDSKPATKLNDTDIQNVNKQLQDYCDKNGISDNGGKMYVNDKGALVVEKKDGSKKTPFSVDKNAQQGSGNWKSARVLEVFLNSRGRALSDKELNEVCKDTYGTPYNKLTDIKQDSEASQFESIYQIDSKYKAGDEFVANIDGKPTTVKVDKVKLGKDDKPVYRAYEDHGNGTRSMHYIEESQITTNDSSKTPDKFTGKNMKELVDSLKEQGFEMDSADQSQPQDTVTLYKDNKEYTATFNKYSDGGVEVINLKQTSNDDAADEVASTIQNWKDKLNDYKDKYDEDSYKDAWWEDAWDEVQSMRDNDKITSEESNDIKRQLKSLIDSSDGESEEDKDESVSDKDYTKLIEDEDEASTPAGEAHNQMVGYLKSNGLKHTSANVKKAAEELRKKSVHTAIMANSKDEETRALELADQFDGISGYSSPLAFDDIKYVAKGVLNDDSSTQDEKVAALSKILGKEFSAFGDTVVTSVSTKDGPLQVHIEPKKKGYFEATFEYPDGASRKETYDSVESVKSASHDFIKRNRPKDDSTNDTN